MSVPHLNFHEYGLALNWVVRAVEYLAKATAKWRLERQQAIEDRILDHLNTKAEPSSLGTIWADVFIRPIIQDVPFGIAFPPELTGWKRFRLELRRLPYEVRHRWRVWKRLIPEERVERLLLKLLRERRVQYDPNTLRYSRRP